VENNIVPYQYAITKELRNTVNKHRSLVLWFTGLSGSGKSTIANLVEIELHKLGVKTYSLDGDNIRSGINKDLDFEPHCRTENIRRIGEIACLLLDAGLVVLASFVSPYKIDRETVGNIVNSTNFVEIFINTNISECKKRDVKGLYSKAEKGEIKNMTGVSAPYEIPENPDIEIRTEEEPIEESVKRILDFISPKIQLNHE
jgi:adenylylsulfate kinase